MDHREVALEVDAADDLAPVLDAGLVHAGHRAGVFVGVLPADAGIADEDVDAAVLVDRGLDDLLGAAVLLKVGRDDDALSACLGDRAQGLAQLLLAAGGADHLGAFAAEQLEGGAADAAAGAGDDGDLAVQATFAVFLAHISP